MPYYPEPKTVWDHGAYFCFPSALGVRRRYKLRQAPRLLVYAYYGAYSVIRGILAGLAGTINSQDGSDHKVRLEAGREQREADGRELVIIAMQ